ncbi:MAG: hypothetical protein U9N42_09565 [Campylobacterota bacterium]|nr:hypothetical protein [Campylobacterota bacterium]
MIFNTNSVIKLSDKYRKEAQELIEEYDYRYRRYKLEYSIVLTYIEASDGVDFSQFTNLRKTDYFHTFQNNLLFMIFDNAAADGAIKAAGNMLAKFEAKYFGKKIYTAVISASDYPSKEEMSLQIFHLLKYCVDNNLSNLVIDESEMAER